MAQASLMSVDIYSLFAAGLEGEPGPREALLSNLVTVVHGIMVLLNLFSLPLLFQDHPLFWSVSKPCSPWVYPPLTLLQPYLAPYLTLRMNLVGLDLEKRM